jgi:amidase
MSNPQSINGALARSVRDAALLLDVAEGHTGGDPFVISAPAGPYCDEVERDPGTCRIALSVSAPNGGSTDPECVAATEAVAATFAELGHHVEIAAPDWPLEALSNSISTFMAAGLAADVGQRLAELGRDLHDDDLELLTRRMFEMGRTLPASAMVVALQDLERAARIIGAFFADHDVLLTPTISRRVPPLGLIDTSDMDSLTHAAAMATYTSPFNVTGQPAISLPAAVDSEGLPIGVQLAAAFGREDLLIRVASQLERARPWDTAPVWPPRT